MADPTTIPLGTYYCSEDDEKATAPGAAATGTVTFLAVPTADGSTITMPAIPTIGYLATDPTQIASLVPGKQFALQLVEIIPPAVTSSETDGTTTGTTGSSNGTTAAPGTASDTSSASGAAATDSDPTAATSASATDTSTGSTDSSTAPEIPAA